MTPIHPHAPARAVRTAVSLGVLLLFATDPIRMVHAHDLSYGGGLSYGVDSNPLELPGEDPSGSFTEARFDLALEPSSRSRLGLMALATGTRRWHSTAAEGADFGWADLKAGFRAVPYRNGSRSLSFTMGGRYGALRTTLIDPDTGEVYAQATGTATTVPIPNRLDFNSTGAFLHLRWRMNRSILAYLDADWLRRDYVEDYNGSPTLQPLDDRALSLEPGIRAILARGLILDISHAWRARTYDQLSSLNQNAAEVAGEEREYAYRRTQLSVRYRVRGDWELLAGYRVTDRTDRHAGYYDTTGTSGVISVAYRVTDTTRLRLLVTRRTLGYANASVNNDPNGESRESEILRYLGEVSHDLGESIALFAVAGTESSDNRDPAYVHDRSWAQAGVRVEF